MSKEVNNVSLSSFNVNHSLYDLVRPSFPDEAVDSLIKNLNLVPGSKVVDLAAGTGKFTEKLLGKGFDITAVEPSTGMLESFHKRIPNVKTVNSGSYNIDLPDNYADAVTIAQAFHWFADGDSLKEISRILKPHGKLGIIWNTEGGEPGDGQLKCAEIVWAYDHGVPQYRHGKWRNAFNDTSYFSMPLHEEFFKWKRRLPKQLVWPMWQSRSYITALSRDEQTKVHAEIDHVLKNDLKPDELDGDDVIWKVGVHTVVTTKV